MMVRILMVVFASAFCIAGFAQQPIALSGKVSNSSGKAIPGASVSLLKLKLLVTANAEGSYLINTDVGVTSPKKHLKNNDIISVRNQRVLISLATPSPVVIETFDLHGKLLHKVREQAATAGNYRFDLMPQRSATNMVAVRVTTGTTSRTFRLLPMNNRFAATFSPLSAKSTIETLAKIKENVDSLLVTAAGYTPKYLPVASYHGTIDISLDTLALEKFSFFVTSLKAIQELSRSENGFGGDLRFGKTGPGAGLLGADSICQCIAERSMKGSGVKQWRAFLSVARGPDGKQVNAVDRIGNGPWYDRLGRVVAMNKADLLHERPVADGDIINDLPNEDGYPNHRPDPGKPEVDNHMTITGSDSLGRLYAENATCEDWTSTTTTTSRPRAGLSWPRADGPGGPDDSDSAGTSDTTFFEDLTLEQMLELMKNNWISNYSLPGCAAGISLEETGGPKPGETIIGSSGGYGGFYCFGLTP